MKIIPGILSKPYILAGFVTLIFLFFLPVKLRKPVLTIQDEIAFNEEQLIFDDLNGDGEMERVKAGSFDDYQFYCLVKDISGKMHGQWNGTCDHVPRSPVFTDDFDNDGYKEIYAFTYKNDSAFINSIECFDADESATKEYFVDLVPLTNEKPGYYPSFIGMYDATNDGFKELYFVIRNGFALYPRKLYRLDIRNDALKSTANMGNIFEQMTYFTDITGDSIPEMFGYVSAVNNFPDSAQIQFKDNSAWLFVFDTELQLLFEPVEYAEPLSVIYPIALKTNTEIYLAVFYKYHGTKTKEAPRIDIYNWKGTFLKKIRLADYGKWLTSIWYPNQMKDEVYFQFKDNTSIFALTDDLKIKEIGMDRHRQIHSDLTSTFTDSSHRVYFHYDNVKRKLVLLDYQFREISELMLAEGENVYNVQHLSSNEGTEFFFVQVQENMGYVLSYHQGIWQPTGAFTLLALYFMLTGFLYLGRWLYQIQVKEKQQTLQQLTRFQMLSVKNQLDPHFAFNAVNTLGSLIYGNNKEKAYNYLLRFSNLLRNQLVSSDKLLTTLQNELEVTRDYLILQKERFGDPFEYNFEVQSEVNQQVLVPRLCIQTYVENAIKHGLKSRGGQGRIEISIKRKNHFLCITVTDNGIGRQNAMKSTTFSTGKGLHSMEQLYAYINAYYKDKIAVAIDDLVDSNGNAAGTKVSIRIPEGLRE